MIYSSLINQNDMNLKRFDSDLTLTSGIKKCGLLVVKIGKNIIRLADNHAAYVCYKKVAIQLKKNIQYKDKHAGKRAFIVANGPSLSSHKLSLLRNDVTFTMSGIWKHQDIGDMFNPTYYCIADPVFFEEKDGFESIKNFFKNAKNKLAYTIFFMPYSGKKVIEKYTLLPQLRTNYVLFSGGLEHSHYSEIDITKTIPGVQSTAQFAIELAIYMGCNPIYLIGFDHDWLAKRGMDRHFYQDTTLKNHPIAHGNLDKYSYKNDLETCLTLWEGYEALQKIAINKSIRIINATKGGYLDVYERANFDTLTKQSNV